MSKKIQLLISPEFAERKILANDSVRLIDEFVDEMDLRELYRAYSRLGRKPATEPDTMLKILIYGYMDRRYSSRDIEKACKRDMNYIWILNGAKSPNHKTTNAQKHANLKAIWHFEKIWSTTASLMNTPAKTVKS